MGLVQTVARAVGAAAKEIAGELGQASVAVTSVPMREMLMVARGQLNSLKMPSNAGASIASANAQQAQNVTAQAAQRTAANSSNV